METFFKTKYLGLSQLLAVPLTYSKPRSPPTEVSEPTSNDQSASRSRLGFVPFKLPEKLDLFDNYHLKSTSESLSESFEEVCSGVEPCPDDKKLNSKSSKNKKGPYRKYTIEEKKLAVQYVIRQLTQLNNGRDLRSVAKEFNIPRRNLLRWRKNGCERKEGGGRPTDSEMETRVFELIRSGDLRS